MSNKEVQNFEIPVEETNAVVETVEEIQTEETNVPEPMVDETPVEVEEEPKTTIGVVSECGKLRVRRKPRMDADVVSIIAFGDEVEVEDNKPNSEFYKVRLADGTIGFCMKKFINVR